MGTSSVIPPPPPGFTLDQPSAAPVQTAGAAIPPPPPGFTLDKPAVEGEQTNDIGKTVIVPKDGESFQDTMKRAAQHGSTVTKQDINDEMATAPKKLPQALGAAAGIGVAGPAGLAGMGEALGMAPEAFQAIKAMVAAHPEATKVLAKALIGGAIGGEAGHSAKTAILGGLLTALLK